MLSPVIQSHPHPRQLKRFMADDLPWSEAALVIRHLLKGCPKCVRVTRQLWRFGDEALASIRCPSLASKQLGKEGALRS